MAKDNLGLVKYAEKALAEKWGYVWGTFGQKLTPAIFAQKLRQYPQGVGNYKNFIQHNWLNKKTADCIGLIKAYMWADERTGAIRYDSKTDVNADMMYNRAKKVGPIRSIPEVPGLAVWRKGHIGVYIGNGEVIEAQGTVYGVRRNKLANRNFTHWLEVPFIDYVEEKKDEVVKVNKPSEWAKKDWEWAKEKGFLDGNRPKDNITREEMAIVIRRIVEAK